MQYHGWFPSLKKQWLFMWTIFWPLSQAQSKKALSPFVLQAPPRMRSIANDPGADDKFLKNYTPDLNRRQHSNTAARRKVDTGISMDGCAAWPHDGPRAYGKGQSVSNGLASSWWFVNSHQLTTKPTESRPVPSVQCLSMLAKAPIHKEEGRLAPPPQPPFLPSTRLEIHITFVNVSATRENPRS